MTDLRTEIESAAIRLQSAWALVQSLTGTILPADCYTLWTKKASLHESLTNTLALFSVRDLAWEDVKWVKSTDSHVGKGELVNHRGSEIDFWVARHLALTSYVAITWSIYDRLANICGRLASAKLDLVLNPKQNPKLFEDFVKKDDTLGFAVNRFLQQAYAWPIKVTYKVRNWLVHDGHESSSTPLFHGNRISDGFILHNGAQRLIQDFSNYSQDNGKISSCCLSASEECWFRMDLVEILEKYHAEIDMMFGGLVAWSVKSFMGQIESFAVRDRATMASRAVT